MLLHERAPAKVNLTLRVLGRRSDGFHDLQSLTAFAGAADFLTLQPDPLLSLGVEGPSASGAGDLQENLVMRAAKALADAIPGLGAGRFVLRKNLPVAAGLGGGSSDAAAALRLLARLNELDLWDERMRRVAAELGSDVPVCLEPQARFFAGRGDEVGAPLGMPPLPAVLVNPGVPVPTAAVFRQLGIEPGGKGPSAGCVLPDLPRERPALLEALRHEPNDLEAPAKALAPAIGEVLEALAALPGCQLARMSGSGATCFALFASPRDAIVAARRLRRAESVWWVRASLLR